MCLERGEAVEGPARDGIALHVADARLRLALCACSIRAAGTRRDAAVGTERAECRVDVHDARLAVAPEDQRAGIVDEHRLCDVAEVQERARKALPPIPPSNDSADSERGRDALRALAHRG